MSSRLAVIPARGGSKRIKNKNIRDFAGRPMICHILQSAVDSELFRDIHVSTDSKLIRDEVNKLGPFASFERPSSLADDDQPIFSTLKYVLSRFHAKGMFFDEIWLLMACAALIEPEDLRLAAASYGQFGGGKNLLAVAPYPAPVEWAFDMDNENSLVPVTPDAFSMDSKQMRRRYYDAGAFAIFSQKSVVDTPDAGSDKNFFGFELDPLKAIDIDTEDDWRQAERYYLMQKRVKYG